MVRGLHLFIGGQIVLGQEGVARLNLFTNLHEVVSPSMESKKSLGLLLVFILGCFPTNHKNGGHQLNKSLDLFILWV